MWLCYNLNEIYFDVTTDRVGIFPLFNIIKCLLIAIIIVYDLSRTTYKSIGVISKCQKGPFNEIMGHRSKIVESKGFELVDMEFVKDMGNRYLRHTLTNRAG